MQLFIRNGFLLLAVICAVVQADYHVPTDKYIKLAAEKATDDELKADGCEDLKEVVNDGWKKIESTLFELYDETHEPIPYYPVEHLKLELREKEKTHCADISVFEVPKVSWMAVWSVPNGAAVQKYFQLVVEKFTEEVKSTINAFKENYVANEKKGTTHDPCRGIESEIAKTELMNYDENRSRKEMTIARIWAGLFQEKYDRVESQYVSSLAIGNSYASEEMRRKLDDRKRYDDNVQVVINEYAIKERAQFVAEYFDRQKRMKYNLSPVPKVEAVKSDPKQKDDDEAKKGDQHTSNEATNRKDSAQAEATEKTPKSKDETKKSDGEVAPKDKTIVVSDAKAKLPPAKPLTEPEQFIVHCEKMWENDQRIIVDQILKIHKESRKTIRIKRAFAHVALPNVFEFLSTDLTTTIHRAIAEYLAQFAKHHMQDALTPLKLIIEISKLSIKGSQGKSKSRERYSALTELVHQLNMKGAELFRSEEAEKHVANRAIAQWLKVRGVESSILTSVVNIMEEKGKTTIKAAIHKAIPKTA